MTYPVPVDDDVRIRVLRSLGVLDTARDENYDRIVRLCVDIFGLPIVAISLVDEERQWFKSIAGLNVCETSRDVAFCNYTVMADEIFEVCDAHEHPVLRDNALVTGEPHLRYYAGAPLKFDGTRLGSLCIIDTVPHEPLSPADRRVLANLAEVVVREMKVQQAAKEALALLPI